MATKRLTVGPILGMNDTRNLSAQDGQRASYLLNMYAPAAQVGGDLISRPGVTRIPFVSGTKTGTINSQAVNAGTAAYTIAGTGTLFLTEVAVGDRITSGTGAVIVTAIATNTSLTAKGCVTGTVNGSFTVTYADIVGGPIYGIWNYQATDGTIKRFLIARSTDTYLTGTSAGLLRFLGASSEILRLVEYDPSNSAHPLTDRTSATMDGVALDITTRIYATTFANYFILSDGTNRPRKITSAFVLTNLTDANYAFTGPLAQYYGKLFGIDASDNVTIRWCDENDPDTGWGTGTSDNSWTLRQTSSDQLQVLVGSNDALYCARNNSWAIITGAANSDFRSSGTIDAVQSIGCRSPDAAFLVNASVVFLDQYGRPGRIEPGYGYIPLWKRVQETIRGVGLSAAQLRAAWGRYDPVTSLVKFALRWSSSATENAQMLCFDVESWECLGVHTWYASGTTAMDHAYSAILLDETNRPRHAIASGTTNDLAFYVQKTEDDQAASARDTLAAGSQMVPVQVDTPWLGGDAIEESQFNRVAVGIRNVGGTTAGLVAWKLAFRTPNVDFATAAAMTVSGTSATFANAVTKAETPGLNAQGRAIQFRFTNDTSGNTDTRATFDTVTVLAVPGDADYARR